MTKKQIQAIQEKVGTPADGYWGPKSIDACQSYLRSLMPHPNPWPYPDQPSLQEFYGSPGDESKLVNIPAPVPMFYEGKKIKTIRCHIKVSVSLPRALTAAYAYAPRVVEVYDGCFNNRKMRGGSLPSLHARGAAIDLNANKNGNLSSWPLVASMPLEVMEAFAVEGWIAAGAFWGRDGMHFQATR